MNNKIYDSLIIGAGPCGIGAAIELKNANKDIAMIEKGVPGGKVNIAPRVDNYPGYKKISGSDLAIELYNRVLSNEIELINDEVVELAKEDKIFKISCKNAIFYSKTVLIASGTQEKKLELDKENKFFGHGLSYCAVCDGHFFKNKDVLVIGGGNAALKEAIYLASFVKRLYLIHRRNEFRGNENLINDLKKFKNVTILTPYIPIQLLGDNVINGVKIQNKENNEIISINVQGVFPLIGQNPNNGFIKIKDVCDEKGTIPVDKTMQTSINGLFAGGDILPRDIRQIYLAEHDGKVAAKAIIEYLG